MVFVVEGWFPVVNPCQPRATMTRAMKPGLTNQPSMNATITCQHPTPNTIEAKTRRTIAPKRKDKEMSKAGARVHVHRRTWWFKTEITGETQIEVGGLL